jgi:hypothetical protein
MVSPRVMSPGGPGRLDGPGDAVTAVRTAAAQTYASSGGQVHVRLRSPQGLSTRLT